MTRDELLKRYPRASESFLKANTGTLPSAEPEPIVCHESLVAPPREALHVSRTLIRITGYRCQLLDPDNFAGGCKYLIDALRYAGLIPDDTPEHITLETRQIKMAHRHQEKTVIEIEEL